MKKVFSKKTEIIIACFFWLAFFLTYLFVIYYVGPYAWDDGAITLAYGKTLAENGYFALTASSEVVEGSSSLLLVFVSGLFFYMTGVGFLGSIYFAQFIALLFLAISLYLLYKFLLTKFESVIPVFMILFFVGFMPMFMSEVMNGMEMTLFAMLFLLLVFSYEERSPVVFIILPLLLLTRFEAIFYLGFSLMGLLFFDKENRARIVGYLIYTGFIFLIITSCRYLYFGDVLPNTIYAKMHPPYTHEGIMLRLWGKISGGMEFFIVYFPMLLIIDFLSLDKEFRRNLARSISAWVILSFGVFAFITGKNWGYSGRMVLAAMPLFIVILGTGAARLADISVSVNDIKIFQLKQRAGLIIAIGGIALTFAVNANLGVSNLKQALIGGYHQGYWLPSNLTRRLDNKFKNNTSYGVTPENYRITGLAVDNLRETLGLEIISFMVPDVGGLGLCCKKIKVIDSALLTNHFMAKNGYVSFPSYLESEDPDVIETHGIWSEVTGIYENIYFKDNFVAVIVDGNLLWLNKRLFGELTQNTLIELKEMLYAEMPASTRYSGASVDQQFGENVYQGKVYLVNWI